MLEPDQLIKIAVEKERELARIQFQAELEEAKTAIQSRAQELDQENR